MGVRPGLAAVVPVTALDPRPVGAPALDGGAQTRNVLSVGVQGGAAVALATVAALLAAAVEAAVTSGDVVALAPRLVDDAGRAVPTSAKGRRAAAQVRGVKGDEEGPLRLAPGPGRVRPGGAVAEGVAVALVLVARGRGQALTSGVGPPTGVIRLETRRVPAPGGLFWARRVCAGPVVRPS